MSTIYRWEYESRKTLEKALNETMDELLERFLGQISKSQGGLLIQLVGDAREKISKELDLFRVNRVKYRHDIIFQGNKKYPGVPHSSRGDSE